MSESSLKQPGRCVQKLNLNDHYQPRTLRALLLEISLFLDMLCMHKSVSRKDFLFRCFILYKEGVNQPYLVWKKLKLGTEYEDKEFLSEGLLTSI
ncbi:hypothetical protein HNY73_004452 [Argiope bruennichi]|uniref:Uncharacterized protein n=1 Tax=Argiope bruennichi TaxID=94029 RepID=A0A8T0FVY1_ARGBR|nr:hypothetical protein HNY73_004452 [Argiope bruennichi]